MKDFLFLKLSCLAVAGLVTFFTSGGTLCVWAQSREDRVAPRQAKSARQSGDIYSKNGEIQKAIEAYEQALKDYPAYAEVYYLLGLIYDLQQGDLKKAITCYQKFLELAPDAPEAVDVRALLQSAIGALSSAPLAEEERPSEDVNVAGEVPSELEDVNAAEEAPSEDVAGAGPLEDVTGDRPPENMPEERLYQASLSEKEEQKQEERQNLKPLPELLPQQPFVSRSINGQVLKYSIKLMVWEREGYTEKFNELASARGSSLSNNISEERARLRSERQKTTEFIDYGKEAEYILLTQMVNELLKEWSMDLPQLPQNINIQKVVPSCQVVSIQEDKKYMTLSLTARINVQNLKEQLLAAGYRLTPIKIQLQCSNLYGEFKDRFLEAIKRKSGYIKGQSEGLYEIYTTPNLFASELSKMMIGTYAIHLDDVDKNKIVFTAKSQGKQP